MNFCGARYHKYVGRLKVGSKQSFTCKNRVDRNKTKCQKVCCGQICFLIQSVNDHQFGIDLNKGFVSFIPHDEACDFYSTNNVLEAFPKCNVLKQKDKILKGKRKILIIDRSKRAIRSDKNKARKVNKLNEKGSRDANKNDRNKNDKKVRKQKKIIKYNAKDEESIEEIDQENRMQIDDQKVNLKTDETSEKYEHKFDECLNELKSILKNLANYSKIKQPNSINHLKKCKDEFDKLFGHFYLDQSFRSKYDQITVLSSLGLEPV